MEFFHPAQGAGEGLLSDVHEELYQLEETYLSRFGIYPAMPDLSADTCAYYVEKIRQSLKEDRPIQDLTQGASS